MKAAIRRKTTDIQPVEFDRPFSLAFYYRRRWRDISTGTPIEATRTPDPKKLAAAQRALLEGLCLYWTTQDIEDAPPSRRHKQAVEVAFAFRGETCFRVDDETSISRARAKWRRDAMARLEVAAHQGDESAFLKNLEVIKWEGRSASDFVRAIKLAFKAGAFKAARYIASEGMKYQPDSAEIQKYARVLNPSQPTITEPTATLGPQANRDWLKAHAHEYKGKWIAIRNGELLGASQSLDSLVEEVSQKFGVAFPSRDVMVTTGS